MYLVFGLTRSSEGVHLVVRCGVRVQIVKLKVRNLECRWRKMERERREERGLGGRGGGRRGRGKRG